MAEPDNVPLWLDMLTGIPLVALFMFALIS